jgi:adenosine deaminase
LLDGFRPAEAFLPFRPLYWSCTSLRRHFGEEQTTVRPVGEITAASAWVAALPKVELHIHLEGSVRPGTMCVLSIERLGSSGPLLPGWEESYYTFTDFAGYMAQLTPRFPGSPGEYACIARECFEDLAGRNVIYAEVSVDGRVRHAGQEHAFWPYMEALEDARRCAQERLGIRLNYILALMRTLSVESALARVRLAIEARDRGFGVVGIDLHGDESIAGSAQFAEAYDLARAHGLGLRAHAGEASGAESVREAIEILRVQRIGHGIRALEDPALVERLQRGDILLEVAPTSNVRTAVVPDLRAHPVRRLYDLGIPIAVSSDDPLPFFTTIEREHRLLVEQFDFSRDDLYRITQNASQHAFLPEEERAALAAKVKAGYEQVSGPDT